MRTRERSKHRKHISSRQQGGKSAQSCKQTRYKNVGPGSIRNKRPQLVQHRVRELIQVACPSGFEIDRASLRIGESPYSHAIPRFCDGTADLVVRAQKEQCSCHSAFRTDRARLQEVQKPGILYVNVGIERFDGFDLRLSSVLFGTRLTVKCRSSI